MGKILGLDIGDKWIGIAISDKLKLIAKPHSTIPFENLNSFLDEIIKKESISNIIVGYPKTLRGTESEQTRKILKQKKTLETIFPNVKFTLWDERLSSKRAEMLKKKGIPSKEEKLKIHAIAAAYILDSYLTFLNTTE